MKKDYSYWEKFLLENGEKLIHSIRHDEDELSPCKTCGKKEPFAMVTAGKARKYISLPDLKLRRRNKCSQCCKVEMRNKMKEKKFTKVVIKNCLQCNTPKVFKNSKGKFCNEQCANTYFSNKRKKVFHKVCEVCNTEFTSNRDNSRVCGDDCKKKTFHKAKVTRTCKTCSKEFEGTLKQVFCSDKCNTYKNKTPTIYYCKRCNVNTVSKKTIELCKCCKKEVKEEAKIKEKQCPTCGITFKTKNDQKTYCKPGHSPANIESRKITKRSRKSKSKCAKLKSESWGDIAKFKLSRPSDDYDLDHIIPLNHPDVCGLHNTWNFQWLKKEDNHKKSNQFDGTNDNKSWKITN
jgi:hypothetical protein